MPFKADQPTSRFVPDKEPTAGESAAAFGKEAFEQAGGVAGFMGGAELGAMAGAPLGPVGSFAGGLVGGLAGAYGGEKLQEKIGEYIPPSIKKQLGFGKEQREKERKVSPMATTAGKYAPDVLAIAPSAYKLGKYGVTKASELAKTLKTPEPVAKVSDLAEVGEKGYKVLTDKASKLYEARSKEAEKLYDDAFDTARVAQAQGVPFAVSPQGQKLIADLEREKSVIAGGKEFEKGEEKIAGINRLIKALKGTTTGGYQRVAKETPAGGKIYRVTGTAPKTTEKDIEAVVEELRFLRDVDAKGKPYEAYSALDAKYKRDLIKRLESALYDWNGAYRAADEAYKAASSKLDPFRTELMSRALRGEKFNPKDLVATPEEFGRTFFSNKGAVQNLKQVVNDDAKVADLAKEYVATLLSNKTPAEVKSWAANPQNTPWLKEAGIFEPVQEFSNKAITAENRKAILNRLGYGAAAAVGLGYASRKALGL